MKIILLYVVLGLLAHAFVLVPLLMGLALNKKKHRDETGKLVFQKESFVLQRICFGGDIDEIFFLERGELPKNICQLYWGIFWGIPLKVPFNVVIRLGCFVMLIAWYSGAIFLGFWPKGRWKFHSYKKCGWHSEQKILLLPWELAVLFILVFTIISPAHTINIIKQALDNPVAKTIGGGVLFLMMLVGIMAVAFLIGHIGEKVESKWAAPFKEFIKAKKKKWCSQINVE